MAPARRPSSSASPECCRPIAGPSAFWANCRRGAQTRGTTVLPSRCHRAVAGRNGAAGLSISRSDSSAVARVPARGRDRSDSQLDPLLDRRIGTLSKGQRKRALLAIGLLTPQPLLLVDEPFDGLDLRQTREVGAALRAHAAAGRTLFLSIHQISDAARVCDRFVLLSGGRVCGEGTLDGAGRRGAAHARRIPRVETWKRCSLRSRRTPVRLAPREGVARAAGVARLVGDAACSSGRWSACPSSARCAPTPR